MFFNITSNRDNDLYFFYGGESNSGEWKAWTIPSSAAYVNIMTIGAGGNGGLGGANNDGIAKGGGGGGGSGGISSAIFRSRTLPSTLFLDFSSSQTTVALEPNNSSNYKIIYANAGSDGVNGTSTGVVGNGFGGAGGVNASSNLPPFITSAITYNTKAGINGTTGGGGNPRNGVSLSQLTSGYTFLTGGAGGGGTSTGALRGIGGSIDSTSFTHISRIAGGSGNASGAGNKGGDGYWLTKPHLIGTGGGGGGAGSTTPGYGGNGGYGCGGGGAGSCVTQDLDSYGRGGPGLIIIKCW